MPVLAGCGRQEDEPGFQIANHFAALALMSPMPIADECAEESIRLIFNWLGPWLAQQGLPRPAEVELSELPPPQTVEASLQARKLRSPLGYRPFLVFDDPVEPKHTTHCRMRVDLGGDAAAMAQVPANGIALFFEKAGEASRAGALVEVGGMAGRVLSVKQAMRQAVNRARPRPVLDDQRGIDRQQRGLPANPLGKVVQQGVVALAKAAIDKLSPGSIRLDQAQAIWTFLAPRQINPNQVHRAV